jgi:aldehyde:ferredoxin oxidoreductase
VLQVAASKYMQLYNAAGGCLFGAQMGGNLPIFEYLNAATGWRRTPHNYLRVGERIQALRQAFNLKHGIVPPRDFAMPRRAIGEPPLDTGPMKGVRIQEERLQRDFLVGMGWDPETAMPTRAKLDELGLAAVAEELGAR